MEKSDMMHLLIELNKISPIGSRQTKTKLEINSERVNKWILIASSFLFLILLCFVAFHKLIAPLPDIAKTFSLLVACLTMLLPTVVMIIDIVVIVWQLIRFKTESFRLVLLEVQHDKSNVENITVFDMKILEETKEWLDIKCSRIKNKISLFFGNPEKIALLSLVGFGWFVYKQVLNGRMPENIPSVNEDPVQFVLLMGVSFFTGLCVGAMLLNMQLRRYFYQLEILEMAIKKKLKMNKL